jgi:hypothetical protein
VTNQREFKQIDFSDYTECGIVHPCESATTRGGLDRIREVSMGDSAAALAADDGTSATAGIHRANLEFEKYFSTDSIGAFLANPPEGFQRARITRPWPAAGLDAQAGTPLLTRAVCVPQKSS